MTDIRKTIGEFRFKNNEGEEDEIIENFVHTTLDIISFIDDEAKEGRCIKKERLKKAFDLSDEDLDLHLKLIRDIDEYLLPIDKDEYCSYSAISEAAKKLKAI